MGVDKLLPCPFCGDTEPEVLREGTSRQSSIVACTNCGAQLEANETTDRTGARWNDRPVDAELAALRQRVSELEAEAVHHRAEWAQAMSDIVRLREALRQWQLGIGDTEAERKIAELQTTLASREAALREIRDEAGTHTVAVGSVTGFSRIYDRAAQEVGRG